RFSRDWSSDVCSSDLYPASNLFRKNGCLLALNQLDMGEISDILAPFWTGHLRDQAGIDSNLVLEKESTWDRYSSSGKCFLHFSSSFLLPSCHPLRLHL